MALALSASSLQLRALSVDLDETQAVMKKDLIALLAKAQGKAADVSLFSPSASYSNSL